MTKYAIDEQEWFPVSSLTGFEPRLGDAVVDLSDEEIARVNAAFEEFFLVQNLLGSRERKYVMEEYEAEFDEDPADPLIRYAWAVEAFDHDPARVRLH